MVAAAHGASPGGSHGIFARALDGTDIPDSLSGSQARILRLVSLSFSSISIFMALVTFYWFLRMRRSFRHE